MELQYVVACLVTLFLGTVSMYFYLRTKENRKSSRLVRIYVDGCWDVMHSGHYNAIRQAKQLGDVLVVGVHSDAEIARHKREPVMNNQQRMAAVQACKWADEVVFDVPYAPSIQLLDKLNCDFVAHGDDVPIASDGKSAYHGVEHRLKIFRRTAGVSTTHLIERLLRAVKSDDEVSEQYDDASSDDVKSLHIETTSSWSTFLASSSRISAFSNNRTPTKDDVVVYIDGIFDLFHIGHIDALAKAKELGTFLYVGLYDDDTVRRRKGKFFPLMNLQERVLNVLSCKFVDDVLIGAPWAITEIMLTSLNIRYVVLTENTLFAPDECNRYEVVRQKPGMLKEIECDCKFSTQELMQNIAKQQTRLERQNEQRLQKAKHYEQNQKFVEEN
eukprot:CAMPEP_0202698872 /NCGR_PEP_ID=MMETSP1385-20130828/12112_1 /ASSEMBLY_ACC=CAM_ASM_000861 /TAXON_ID=933848 /ORGANISM="Elphidium margaritaceum" /LENGTH=385 /DNA_ID=CAMNT_0049355689 /DNA_START=32 /DNA_END=1189 /DNA_ORIENTATION=-